MKLRLQLEIIPTFKRHPEILIGEICKIPDIKF